jgi:hypothetical protein
LKGIYLNLSNTSDSVTWAFSGSASGTGTNYGFQAISTGGITDYGIFASASGGSTDYAIYATAPDGTANDYGLYVASGNAYFADKVGIGTTDPGTNTLKVAGNTEITGNLKWSGVLDKPTLTWVGEKSKTVTLGSGGSDWVTISVPAGLYYVEYEVQLQGGDNIQYATIELDFGEDIIPMYYWGDSISPRQWELHLIRYARYDNWPFQLRVYNSDGMGQTYYIRVQVRRI